MAESDRKYALLRLFGVSTPKSLFLAILPFGDGMARIQFHAKTDAAQSRGQEENSCVADVLSAENNADLDQLSNVIALYTVLVDVLYKMRACLLDQRHDEVPALRRQCLDILKTLQNGLEKTGELSENLHLLYGHCVKRLTDEQTGNDVESLDAVRMVITRLKHVYRHLQQKSAVSSEHEPLE